MAASRKSIFTVEPSSTRYCRLPSSKIAYISAHGGFRITACKNREKIESGYRRGRTIISASIGMFSTEERIPPAVVKSLCRFGSHRNLNRWIALNFGTFLDDLHR